MDDRRFDGLMEYYFSEGTEAFLPHVSVNCVVLAYRYPKLQVLSLKMPGQELSMIPGGYVKKTESLEEAAYRNLGISGVKNIFLRQIKTFGSVKRMFDIDSPAAVSFSGSEKVLRWARQRFISVVYYGLIQTEELQLILDDWIPDPHWIDIDEMEILAMDHAEIVTETRKILANEIFTQPILSSLLPATFTLNELRGLFEVILNRPIDRGTFRRKMLKLGLIEQVDQRQDNLGRPSHIFRFQKDNYYRFLAEENKFGF